MIEAGKMSYHKSKEIDCLEGDYNTEVMCTIYLKMTKPYIGTQFENFDKNKEFIEEVIRFIKRKPDFRESL